MKQSLGNTSSTNFQIIITTAITKSSISTKREEQGKKTFYTVLPEMSYWKCLYTYWFCWKVGTLFLQTQRIYNDLWSYDKGKKLKKETTEIALWIWHKYKHTHYANLTISKLCQILTIPISTAAYATL